MRFQSWICGRIVDLCALIDPNGIDTPLNKLAGAAYMRKVRLERRAMVREKVRRASRAPLR